MVDLGPVSPFPPDWKPGPAVLMCFCSVCEQGGTCTYMLRIRYAKARSELLSHLTTADLEWLFQHGWDGT